MGAIGRFENESTPKPQKLVQRVAFQRFERTEVSNTLRPGFKPDHVSEQAFKSLLNGAVRAASGGHRGFVWGSEDKKARRTRMVPAGHVITHVKSQKHHSVSTDTFAEVEMWVLELTYTWGPYSSSVQVDEKSEAKAYGETYRHGKQRSIPRHQVDPEYLPAD